MSTLGDEILEELRKIAPEVAPETVDRARPLPDQLDLDSMDYQRLLAALSDRYRVAIAEDDLPRLQSIDDLVAYILPRTQAV